MSVSQVTKPLSGKRAISVCQGFGWLPRVRLISVVAAGFSVLVLSPVDAIAQETGTLTGIVTGANAAPLAQARVTISGTLLTAATDLSGNFRIPGIPPGIRTLEVKIVGYAPLALEVEVSAGETFHISLQMSAEPVVLSSVEVTADSVSPALRGFEARRARGNGRFFDHDDILRMQPRVFTDVLRRVAGVQVQPGIETYGSGSSVQMGRNSGGMGARTCPVEYYLDGAPFPLGGSGGINHFIPPEEVVAVEIYAGASQIPQQFSSGMYNTRCGVVVIWTRNGPEKRSSR